MHAFWFTTLPDLISHGAILLSVLIAYLMVRTLNEILSVIVDLGGQLSAAIKTLTGSCDAADEGTPMSKSTERESAV